MSGTNAGSLWRGAARVALASGLCFFGLLCWLGALDSDLGGDPDEAAHAVTALMVADYLRAGLGESPMTFAARYYESFPKVALGHYPPGFYVPTALLMACVDDWRLLFAAQAVFLGLLAGLGWWFACRHVTGGDRLAALIVPVLLLAHGEVLRVGCHVLADLLLAGLVFGSLWAWLRWMRSPGWRAAFGFGLVAAAAILTKGSAMGLAGVPLLAAALARRWRDPLRPDWWIAALPVAMLAGPWMLFSVKFTQEGLIDTDSWSFFIEACRYYRDTIPRVFGWPLLLLLALSLARVALGRAGDDSGKNASAVLWAGCLSMLLLVMVVPTGFSPRYLLPMLLPVILLALIELCWLAARFAGARARLAAPALAAGLVLLTAPPTWRAGKSVRGYDTLARDLVERGGGRWLVSSDARGEGALVAAAAFALPRPARLKGDWQVLRATKVLVETDWLSQKYNKGYSDTKELLAAVEKVAPDWILVDLAVPAGGLQPHMTDLKTALDTPGSGWELDRASPVQRSARLGEGELFVYRRPRQTREGETP